jgi:hypothetical protein
MSEKKENNECFAGEQGITCGCKECNYEHITRDMDFNKDFDKYLKKYQEHVEAKKEIVTVKDNIILNNNKYSEKAAAVSKLVEEKQAAYGDSFSNSGDILRKLFPNGITPDKYDDLLSITRIIDKLFRIANQKDAFGESPYDDIIGYALLGATSSRGEKK